MYIFCTNHRPCLCTKNYKYINYQIVDFGVMKPYSLVRVYQRFGGTYASTYREDCCGMFL
jgi:hypothetical protein